MPLIVSSQLPAYRKLEQEGVPIMRRQRAEQQDIRPLNIGLLNLMPSAVYQKTEEQFFRLLGNTPLQINPVLLRLDTQQSTKQEGREHLDAFYQPWREVQQNGLDGLIITGANIEHLTPEQITFWHELQEVFQWADQQVTSTIYSCWSAYTALRFFYGLEQMLASEKIFGCFEHSIKVYNALTKNMDDDLLVPHSRFGGVARAKLEQVPELDVLITSDSEQAQWHAAASRNLRRIFLQGHPEYDREDLHHEYLRDKANGQATPGHYYPDDDANKLPRKNWAANAQVFYSNWINHVYQTTGFDPLQARME